MRPVSRSSRRTALATLIGIENPMDCASSEMNVLIPMTLPQRSTRGPPELPGLIGASVWMSACSDRPGRSRFSPLTMPRVIVCSRPIGLPIAATSSPTRSWDESPSRATSSGAPVSKRISARSSSVSRPRSRAGAFRPESSVTVSEAAPSTTCALVSTWPSRSNRAVARLLAMLLGLTLSLPAAARAADGVLAATLDNGLRVLLLEDHRSPIVSFQVWYRVGSRNEQRGATGIAHFLEHMMFKGTPTRGPKQFARLVEENGGQDNAFTSQDVTSYFVDIAADKLDLVIELEADRMQNLLLDA